MRIIELDAIKWKIVLEFYYALLASIGAPERHGINKRRRVAAIWNDLKAPTP